MIKSTAQMLADAEASLAERAIDVAVAEAEAHAEQAFCRTCAKNVVALLDAQTEHHAVQSMGILVIAMRELGNRVQMTADDIAGLFDGRGVKP